jgi:hypothetical protein
VSDLRKQLSELGYVSIDGQDSSFLTASSLGRVGQSVLLSARNEREADPWSLSGKYGLNKFPWHTDGAVSTEAPDIILLRAIRLSDPTFTELLDPPTDLMEALAQTVLRVKNRAGRVRYLPAVVPTKHGQNRIRWDPRTCKPVTGIATTEEVEKINSTARIDWEEGRLLVIDNTRLLHRRPNVAPNSARVLERTYVWEL